MRQLFVSAALAAALAAPLSAQSTMAGGQENPRRPISVSVVGYGGYVMFGDQFESARNIEDENTDSYLVGGQVLLGLRRNVSLYAGAGYARSEWTFHNYFRPGATTPGNDLFLKKVHTVLYEGGVQLGWPRGAGTTSTGFMPFVQLGVGAYGYYPADDDENRPRSFESTGQTNFAYNVGLGADISTGKVGLRVMAKDYLSSLHWLDGRNPDIHGHKLANNLALTAGLTLHLFDF